MATSSPGGFQEPAFREPGENPFIRWALIGLGLFLVLGLGWFIYSQMTGTLTTKVKDDQKVTAITPMTPPPPPPPPPPPKPEEKPPEPTDAPKPTPEPAAAPKPDAPAPMTVAADAQAGNDAFGLQAGSGAGMGGGGSNGTCVKPPCGTGGGGLSDGLYKGMLKRAIQAAISGDSRVNKYVFTNNFAIVVTPGGRVTAVELRSGSGKANVDKMLADILEGLSVPPPPVQKQYPVVIQVRGRNPLSGGRS